VLVLNERIGVSIGEKTIAVLKTVIEQLGMGPIGVNPDAMGPFRAEVYGPWRRVRHQSNKKIRTHDVFKST
jgi:hypothetical protein